MLKYRAVFADPAVITDRPVSILGGSLELIQKWAAGLLKSAPSENATVQVFQTVETELEVYGKGWAETFKEEKAK